MKRWLARALLSVILVTCLIPSAAAGVLASDYIGYHNAWMEAKAGEILEVYGEIEATGSMSKIGISKVVLQKKGLIFWGDEATYTGTVANGMLITNKISYTKGFAISGVEAGEQYRAKVTLYAGDSTGSDSYTITTGSVTAKK